MSASPFFTIITATYNAARTLPRLLESLTIQTCRDFELVIQDGVSTDETLTVAEAYRGRLPHLSIASEPDTGIYDAWNRALPRVRGDWVLFLGADDHLADEGVLATVREALADCSETVLFAAGSARMVRPDGELFEYIRPEVSGAPRILRREMPACHTAIFHRASLFQYHTFNTDYRILGDYDLLCRAWVKENQGMELLLCVTEMTIGGISFSLENQPATFWESVTIQWRNFSWIPPGRLKILGNSLCIKGLCVLLGGGATARFIDATRRLCGKPPKWTLLPPVAGRAEAIDPVSVTAVVLNYNGREDTLACLRSLHAMPDRPGRIIVVDNASQDGSVPCILKQWQEFAYPVRLGTGSTLTADVVADVLLELPENGGYASGNNAGVRLALRNPACRAVWILNNDTEPTTGALDALCRRLHEVSGAGLTGSTLVYAHDRETVQCAGGFAFSKYTGATPALYGNAPLSSVCGLEPEPVEGCLRYLSGASMLIRREVFERIGNFAEEYFLYYEDAEFGLRARKNGYALAWAPGSVVFHKEGGSTGAESATAGRGLQRSRFVDYLALRNRIYLVRRYFPWCLPLAVASYAGVILNRLRRGQGDRVPLVCKALLDGLRGRMGKPDICAFFGEKRQKRL